MDNNDKIAAAINVAINAIEPVKKDANMINNTVTLVQNIRNRT